MKRTNIHLEDDQREWLKERSKLLGVKPAALVRSLIDSNRGRVWVAMWNECLSARRLARDLHHQLVLIERTVGDELREEEYPWLIDETDTDIL